MVIRARQNRRAAGETVLPVDQYVRWQALASIVSAVFTVVISAVAAWIAYLQYDANNKDVALELARSRPRYSGYSIERGDMTGPRSNALAVETRLSLSGGEYTESKFQIIEIVSVLEGVIEYESAPQECRYILIGYWDTALNLGDMKSEPILDIERIHSQGVYFPSGKRVYLNSERTEWFHNYLNVFGREAIDLIAYEYDKPRIYVGSDVEKFRTDSPITLTLTRREAELPGYTLMVVSRAGDYRPFQDRLPPSCRQVFRNYE